MTEKLLEIIGGSQMGFTSAVDERVAVADTQPAGKEQRKKRAKEKGVTVKKISLGFGR